MTYFISINKNTYLLLYLGLAWLLAFTYNFNFNSNSKYNFYAKNDADFMHTFDTYLNESLNAIKHIEEWILMYSIDKPLFNNIINDTANQLCVGIITKKRHATYFYPVQSVASLLTRTKLKYQANIFITFLNVDDEPLKHDDLIYLDNLIGSVQVPAMNKDWNKTKLVPKVKEAFDYAKIMEYFYTNKTACKYALLVEDDSIAAFEWYEKIYEALRIVDDKEPKSTSKWLCIKLFTSYRYFDFLTHMPTLIKTILVTFLASFIQMIVLISLRLIKFKFLRHFELYALFLNTLLIVFWLNFTHISPLGYGISEYSIGFNTVANVYPRSILGALSLYIERYVKRYLHDAKTDITSFLPKDLLLKEFKNEFRLKEYIVEPAVFQHVGLQSSFSQRLFDKFNIFKVQYRPFQSYSFNKEYLRPIVFDPNYWYI